MRRQGRPLGQVAPVIPGKVEEQEEELSRKSLGRKVVLRKF